MKKLSLFLVLVLVFSCVALAACGGNEDNTSADTSSTAGDTSSKADTSKDTSSKAEESSEAESSEEESSEEEPVEPVEVTGENIALGKEYTVSQLYQQGGAEVEWGWDPDAEIAYPDDGGEMTDGSLAETADFQDAAWIGFHAKGPDYGTTGYHWITVNLGETYDITGAKVYVGTGELGGGIGSPATIELLTSDDGEEWTSAITVSPTNTTTEEGIATECVELGALATCQYVQLRFVADVWCFVSEVEIYSEAE